MPTAVDVRPGGAADNLPTTEHTRSTPAAGFGHPTRRCRRSATHSQDHVNGLGNRWRSCFPRSVADLPGHPQDAASVAPRADPPAVAVPSHRPTPTAGPRRWSSWCCGWPGTTTDGATNASPGAPQARRECIRHVSAHHPAPRNGRRTGAARSRCSRGQAPGPGTGAPRAVAEQPQQLPDGSTRRAVHGWSIEDNGAKQLRRVRSEVDHHRAAG
jgi:hypothetical protein